MILVDPLMAMTVVRGAQALPSYLEGIGTPREQAIPLLRAEHPDWHDCDVSWKAEAQEQCNPAAVRGLFGSGDWIIAGDLAQVAAPLLLLLADQQYTIIPPALLEIAEQALQTKRQHCAAPRHRS